MWDGNVGGSGDLVFKKDCTDLVRRISLLMHFVEEINDSGPSDASSSDSSSSWWSDLVGAVQAAKRLLVVAASFKSSNNNSVSTN